jgi:microcin C transport system substrate-binding protein
LPKNDANSFYFLNNVISRASLSNSQIKMGKFFFIIFINCLFTKFSYANPAFKHGFSIFGELKYKQNFMHFDYVDKNAQKKGEIKFGVEGTFNSLNPFILKGISVGGIDFLYDSLAEKSDDEIGSFYGLIAKEINLDETSIAFKLRKDARWHDGKKITADDVVFTFYKLVEEGHPAYKIAYYGVKNIVKKNPYEVKFEFNDNKNKDLPALIAQMKILPKHYYKKVKFNETSLEPPVGSGPYKIKEVSVGKRIIYERVRDYWAQDIPINKGRYNFSNIYYEYYKDNNVLIEGFKAGKYDFREENVARNWANAYNIKKVESGEIIKKTIPHSLMVGMQAFVLNLRKEKFQDIALRKALTYGFDFEWLNDHIFYGAYKRTNSYFQNSEFSYKNFSLPRSSGDGFNHDNMLEARKILLASGYKFHHDLLLDKKTNKPIEVEFLIDSKAFEMVISPFIKNLRKIGILAKSRFIEENQYAARVRNFDFDVIVSGFSNSQIPGNELMRYWHSSYKNIVGGQNLSGLNDNVVDKLVEEISMSKNKNKIKNLCKKLDKVMLENYYVIPQWHNNTYRILYRDIFKMPKIQPKYSLGIDTWFAKN